MMNKKLGLLLKWLIFGAMMWYVYAAITEKGESLQQISQIISQKSSSNIWTLLVVATLTPLNWACEAVKWKILAQKVEKISFLAAFKGVLVGLSMGFVMPANVGDAIGRVGSLQTKKRLEAIGAAILANGFQFYVSLFFGTIGWAYLLNRQPHLQTWYGLMLLIMCVLALVFGVWLLINRYKTEHYLERFGWFRWLEKYVDVIVRYSPTELRQAFGWATLRYFVFTIQFMLLMHIFGINMRIFESTMGVFLVFFAKTIVPALNFLGDLGVRESASLFVFSLYGINPAATVAVTLTLWFINIFLPVLVGVVWFLVGNYGINRRKS